MPPEEKTVQETTQSTNGSTPDGDEETQLTQEQMEALPDWARDSIQKANSQAAKYRTERNDLRGLVEKFKTVGPDGTEIPGEERLNYLHQATSTEEGIKSIFEELVSMQDAPRVLGVSEKKLKSLMSAAEEEVQTEAEEAEERTGTPLTQEQIDRLVEEKVQSHLAGHTEKQTEAQVSRTVTAHMKSKGYEDPLEHGLILQFAAKRQSEVQIDPRDTISSYVEATDLGIKDFEDWKKTQAEKAGYTESKRRDRETSPSSLKGSGGPASEEWDPSEMTWDELTREADRRGYFE